VAKKSQVGKNTVSGKELTALIERIERLKSQKKEIGDMIAAVKAEATAKGFSAARINEILKIREMPPHDRQEAEQELQMYLHALGMDTEAPLFRAVGAMNVDLAVKEQVIEAFKLLVPTDGEVVVTVGGSKVRLWRDSKGECHAADVVDKPQPATTGFPDGSVPPQAQREIPDVEPAGALELGKVAYDENEPITANPFPYGDKRRPKWDEGWRKASGSDGMGED
jgi:uncharacterized protein (UPF0335 family)